MCSFVINQSQVKLLGHKAQIGKLKINFDHFSMENAFSLSLRLNCKTFLLRTLSLKWNTLRFNVPCRVVSR